MPTFSQVHNNAALANLSLQRPSQNFLADYAFPSVTVAKKSDLYYIHDDEREANRETDDSRNPGAEARLVDAGLSTATYTTGGHALATMVTDEERNNADTPLRPDMDATIILMDKIRVNKDIGAKVALDAALTSGQTAAAASGGWNGAGTPITDINAGITQIETAGGVTPNIMIMDSVSWRDLRNHDDIVERVVSGGGVTNDNPANISTRGVADLFGLDDIHVSPVVKNTGISGQAQTDARVWSDDVYLLWCPMNPGIKTYSCGIGFNWMGTNGSGVSQNGFGVMTERRPLQYADIIQVDAYYDLKVVASTAGYRISNVNQ